MKKIVATLLTLAAVGFVASYDIEIKVTERSALANCDVGNPLCD